MLKIAIVLGSTRPGRLGGAVSKWTYGNGEDESRFRCGKKRY